MLSDEEKEIFNNLKDYMQSKIDNGYHKFIYNDLDWDFKCIDCINAIDKVLKQSKEIEELKDKYSDEKIRNTVIKRYNEVIKKDYVNKDKIKAKIEEYKKQIKKMEKDDVGIGFTLGKEWSDLKAKVEFGQSLLEKEKK